MAYRLIGITDVFSNNKDKGIKCLISTPQGVEQAVISCNTHYYKAATAILEYIANSIDNYQKNIDTNSTIVRFLN